MFTQTVLDEKKASVASAKKRKKSNEEADAVNPSVKKRKKKKRAKNPIHVPEDEKVVSKKMLRIRTLCTRLQEIFLFAQAVLNEKKASVASAKKQKQSNEDADAVKSSVKKRKKKKRAKNPVHVPEDGKVRAKRKKEK